MDKKLCVYAICKNEEKYVKQWYDNVKDADYVCVLDTGSTDKTYKILSDLKKKHPEQIIIKKQSIIPWRFDVARNESMKLIPEDAEILVCTDFDELFTTENWVAKVKDCWEVGKTNRVHYSYSWSHNQSGEKTDIFIYDKIHTRKLKWIFPVHEVLSPIDTDSYEEDCVELKDLWLEHFQNLDKPRKYYFDLLKLSMDENPDNPHVRMLYAREFLLNQQYDESLSEYLKTLEMKEIDNPRYRLVLLESLGRCASIYLKLGNYDEAIWYCHEFIKEDPTYREPYFILAEVYNKLTLYTLAEATIKVGLQYGTRKFNWIERANTWTCVGDHLLAIAEMGLKNYETAIDCLEKVLLHEPDNLQASKDLNKCYKCVLAKYKKEK